ncbi:MAG: YraN family protein [Pseudomonadota bacterium]
MTREERRRREHAGRRAERIAAWLLRLKGYRILEQRFRTPLGEIDIIAQRGKTLVFCEVKQRRDETAAREAITVQQRTRIARAAQTFVMRRPRFAAYDQRIDAVLLVPRRLPVHMLNITAA